MNEHKQTLEQGQATNQATTETTTGQTGNTTPAEGGKTFTQEDVNRIVQERLAKERAKADPAADPLAEREKELAKREFAIQARDHIAAGKPRPDGLADALIKALGTTDMEAFKASLTLLEPFLNTLNPNRLPSMPPAGNPPPAGDAVRDAFGLNKIKME